MNTTAHSFDVSPNNVIFGLFGEVQIAIFVPLFAFTTPPHFYVQTMDMEHRNWYSYGNDNGSNHGTLQLRRSIRTP